MSSRDSSGQGPPPVLDLDEWFRSHYRPLRSVARRTLQNFPAVSPWAEVGDVLQGALFRLLRTLPADTPVSSEALFGRAVEAIRRECLDLARRYEGPAWQALHAPGAGADREADQSEGLEEWTAFHEAAGKLLPAEHKLLRLVFYERQGQAEAAALLGVSVRTFQRGWRAMLRNLRRLTGR
jgi:RNA polymerase sigma factor (sigma-70 family)